MADGSRPTPAGQARGSEVEACGYPNAKTRRRRSYGPPLARPTTLSRLRSGAVPGAGVCASHRSGSFAPGRPVWGMSSRPEAGRGIAKESALLTRRIPPGQVADAWFGAYAEQFAEAGGSVLDHRISGVESARSLAR